MENFKADIEPISSVLRIFSKDCEYGDQYCWCCTIRWVNQKKVELCGVTEFPKLEYRKSIAKALWLIGVKEVFFIRIKDGKPRTVIFDVETFVRREKWM